MSNQNIKYTGWSPFNLGSGLVAWWDPETGITKDGVTDRVSSWVDKINGCNASQPTGGNQPLWVSAAPEMNNRNSVYFDTNRVLFANGTVPAVQRVWQGAHTIVAVARGTSYVMGNGAGTAGTFLLMLFSTKVRAHVWGNSGSRTIDGTTTVSATTRALIAQRSTGAPGSGNLDPILNGISDATAASIGGTPATALNWISLGGYNSVPAGSAFSGHLGDLFIFNRALTNFELIQLSKWASMRWSL